MKLHKILCSALVALAFTPSCLASDFFSTDAPERMMSLGVRLGVNTSNVTMNKKMFPVYNINSWGTGFDAGVVADVNFRDYISVQPGFFYQSRTGRYFYGGQIADENVSGDTPFQVGHIRSYRFYIPIVASLHLNFTDNLRWNVDFGPYLGVNLYSNEENKIFYHHYEPDGTLVTDPLRLSGVEFGLKMGTGLRILDHYVVGVHYMAGMTRGWKYSYAGGRDKCWTFTIGYDF